MASPSDAAVCQFVSRIIEIDNFKKKTSLGDWKGEYVSVGDDSFKFTILLWPNGFQQEARQTDPGHVYISLQSKECSAESWINLDVSLIDVNGGKQLTQSFGKSSSLVEKEGILSRFTSRECILDSRFTYLHAGTLKVLFEVSLLKEGSGDESWFVLNAEKERLKMTNLLSSDYASLLESGAFSDVTLLVGEKEFPVHKAILSARSPVFAKMFTQSTENRLVLEEMDEQVFSELLNFIYSERVDKLSENASALLIAAEKYQMKALRDICCQHLSATLTTDNLLSHLQLAYQYKAGQLQKECLVFFDNHSRQIKMSQEWTQLITVKSALNQKLLGLLLLTVMATQ